MEEESLSVVSARFSELKENSVAQVFSFECGGKCLIQDVLLPKLTEDGILLAHSIDMSIYSTAEVSLPLIIVSKTSIPVFIMEGCKITFKSKGYFVDISITRERMIKKKQPLLLTFIPSHPFALMSSNPTAVEAPSVPPTLPKRVNLCISHELKEDFYFRKDDHMFSLVSRRELQKIYKGTMCKFLEFTLVVDRPGYLLFPIDNEDFVYKLTASNTSLKKGTNKILVYNEGHMHMSIPAESVIMSFSLVRNAAFDCEVKTNIKRKAVVEKKKKVNTGASTSSANLERSVPLPTAPAAVSAPAAKKAKKPKKTTEEPEVEEEEDDDDDDDPASSPSEDDTD